MGELAILWGGNSLIEKAILFLLDLLSKLVKDKSKKGV
jgi:hypothetical protein